MIVALAPQQANELLALGSEGAIDVIDVREPDEWSRGHIPTARNVPLGELRARPAAHFTASAVLLVCAHGMRSQTAAALAEAAGVARVYHLEGGTEAWRAQGFPLSTPTASASASPSASAIASRDAASAGDRSCGLPDPGLDVVVGANMRQLRRARNLSLDELASQTGISRTVLGQVELGKTPSSVSLVWKIAQAFGVPFSTMLASAAPRSDRLLRAADAQRLVSPDGRFSSRALFPLEDRPAAEFYELYLGPHSREDAAAHQPGTRENLVVTAGRLELYVGGVMHELGRGDAMVFAADVPHAYVNPGAQECWMYLVMTYAG